MYCAVRNYHSVPALVPMPHDSIARAPLLRRVTGRVGNLTETPATRQIVTMAYGLLLPVTDVLVTSAT